MPTFISNLTMQGQYSRYNVLKIYFTTAFSYKEICNFLLPFHRIKITIRLLNHLLRQCNLKRIGNPCNINPLSANPMKWPNTLKQFVGNLPMNCLSVFGHFVNLN